MTDYDPRIVDLYDGDNPDGPDHDFYRALADELHPESVLDLGCGTGMLTVSLQRSGRSVVGLDPSTSMLNFARRRQGGEFVTWVTGDSRSVPHADFDYAVMTGNVAQHIPDGSWELTLQDLRRCMRAGAVLAFESRNPSAEAWRNWTSDVESLRQTAHGPLREWSVAEEVSPGRVKLTAHNLFEESGDHVIEVLELAFRDRDTIERQLVAAGFRITAVYGDWNRSAFSGAEALMVFVASAR